MLLRVGESNFRPMSTSVDNQSCGSAPGHRYGMSSRTARLLRDRRLLRCSHRFQVLNLADRKRHASLEIVAFTWGGRSICLSGCDVAAWAVAAPRREAGWNMRWAVGAWGSSFCAIGRVWLDSYGRARYTERQWEGLRRVGQMPSLPSQSAFAKSLHSVPQLCTFTRLHADDTATASDHDQKATGNMTMTATERWRRWHDHDQ